MKLVCHSIFLLVLAFAPSAEMAAAKTKSVARSKKLAKVSYEKKLCTPLELKQQNCTLKVGETRLGLLHERWRFNDGIWINVNDVPLSGEGVSWHKVTLNQFGARRVLQLWLWTPSQGEANVQNLKWFVVELGESESPVRVQEIVRRRRLVVETKPAASEDSAAATPTRKPAAASKPKYNFDPEEKTDLKLLKDKLQWQAGRRHGEF
jgi:hypothetical protein